MLVCRKRRVAAVGGEDRGGVVRSQEVLGGGGAGRSQGVSRRQGGPVFLPPRRPSPLVEALLASYPGDEECPAAAGRR